MRPDRLAILLLALVPACAAAEEAAVSVEPLRRYGYVIGDEVELRAAVRVPSGYELDAASLPKPGRVSPFLELRAIEHRGTTLSLRFQVVNSATEVGSAQTPAVTLRFARQGAAAIAATVPQVDFTVSPLTPTHVVGVDGLAALQPDAPAPPVSGRAARARLLAYALVAVLLSVYFAWREGWLPRRLLARRSFARAVSDLRRMRAAAPAAAFGRLHRAFDEAAGFAVASHSLERFFSTQPWARALEADIRSFFAGSARVFYAADATAAVAPDQLLQLARALAELEPRRVKR